MEHAICCWDYRQSQIQRTIQLICIWNTILPHNMQVCIIIIVHTLFSVTQTKWFKIIGAHDTVSMRRSLCKWNADCFVSMASTMKRPKHESQLGFVFEIFIFTTVSDTKLWADIFSANGLSKSSVTYKGDTKKTRCHIICLASSVSISKCKRRSFFDCFVSVLHLPWCFRRYESVPAYLSHFFLLSSFIICFAVDCPTVFARERVRSFARYLCVISV